KPEVEAEDEDENEAATFSTITCAPYRVQPFSCTTYVGSGSSRKVFAPGPIGKDVDILHRKKKLKVSQQEKEKIEQAFRHVVDLIRKQFGVEIPPWMDDGDVTTPDNAHL
nr:hypothetical protein [Tanacetum cinerariifolium]